MSIDLIRRLHLDAATLGQVILPNGAEVLSLERGWIDNAPWVSCIPCGEYVLEWDTTGRVKNVPRLRDVPGRTQINIHQANWAHQLQGCIALGMNWGWDSNRQVPYLTGSELAMDLLFEALRITEETFVIGGKTYEWSQKLILSPDGERGHVHPEKYPLKNHQSLQCPINITDFSTSADLSS